MRDLGECYPSTACPYTLNMSSFFFLGENRTAQCYHLRGTSGDAGIAWISRERRTNLILSFFIILLPDGICNIMLRKLFEDW